MKKFKKILSFALVFVLCLSMSVEAFAVGDYIGDDIVLNHATESEFEVAMQKTEELQRTSSKSFTNSELTPIDEYKIAFDKRVQLSEDSLKKMGYSKDDIQIMKAYANGDIPFIQAASATSAQLTTRFICSSHTSSKYIFTYEWSWDKLALAEGTDICAIGIVGINNNSMAMVSTISSASSSITYIYSDGSMYQSSSIATEKLGEGASSSFVTSKMNSTGDRLVWAKEGSIRVVVVPAVSGNAFAAVRVAGEYGHSTSSSNTSISATVNVNPATSTISFTFKLSGQSTTKITKMGYKQSIYYNDGSVAVEQA